MNKLKNAVVILNYNDSKTVIDYINLIKDYKNIDKILIVDNCSPDGSYEKLKKLKSKRIDVVKTDGNKGYAYGNNYGVHYLEKSGEHYDFITISNPDIYVEDDTIKKLMDFLSKHKDVAIASPTMYMLDNKPSPLAGWKERKLDSDVRDSNMWMTRRKMKPHVECYPKEHFKGDVSYVDCVPGSFFMIKYDAFKDVDYFDENTFLFFEEDILGKKLKNKGYKVVVLNKLRFTHYESVTINKNLKYLKKYKALQKSKKYYHKTYNEECQGLGRLNLLKLDFATFVGAMEIRNENSKFYKVRKSIKEHLKYDGLFMILMKFFIYFLILVMFPFRYLKRKLCKTKKVCYFSLVTWKWIKQRPHFVALKLCDKFKVDYRYLDLKDKYKEEANRKNANSFVNNKVDNKNLRIKPYYIYPGDRKYRIKRAFAYLKIVTFNYDMFIFTQPNQIDTIFIKALKLNKTKIYYECMDNYIGWEKERVYFEFKEKNVIDSSEKVFVSSQKLLDDISLKYGISKDKFILVRNGYDHHLFDNYKKVETKLVNPSITYIGTIDEWFDIENIVNYTKKHKKYNFNIIGPINPSVKKKINSIKLNNLIIHGPIEHDLVPSYIENSNVMIMPFIINEIIEYVDPVKVYEYLYFKKNIVSSYWSELDQFNGLIYYYHNDKEFEKTIDDAINNKFNENKKYKTIMEESKWDNRLKVYLDTLEGNK